MRDRRRRRQHPLVKNATARMTSTVRPDISTTNARRCRSAATAGTVGTHGGEPEGGDAERDRHHQQAGQRTRHRRSCLFRCPSRKLAREAIPQRDREYRD
jgi:hypothetical protein